MKIVARSGRRGSDRGAGRRPIVPLASALVVLLPLLSGCYSFKGGAPPAGIRTITIPQVEDNSGYGRATVRQEMTQQLVGKFRDDNSLRVVDPNGADSRLEVTIVGINDKDRQNISTTEYETVLGLVIDAHVTFTDNVKKRAVFKDKDFVGRSSYKVSAGEAGRVEAIRLALDKLTSDILLDVVAGW